MVVRVATVAFEGIEARPVDVQVQITNGSIVFNVVGLGDKAVAESRERVRSALTASGLALPAKRITVNLAPADLPKEGSHYDLPIALGEMLQTPMVLTLHSPPTPWLESALQTSRRRPWLVAVSEASARMWGMCDAVIPNGIDLNAWPAGAGGDDLVAQRRAGSEPAGRGQVREGHRVADDLQGEGHGLEPDEVGAVPGIVEERAFPEAQRQHHF